MRRVRIQTAEPLPALKAWYPLPAPSADADACPNTTSVATLKQRICRDLGIQGSNIDLEVDGFALLDTLPYESIVDIEKDILLVKIKATADQGVASLKRKDTTSSLVVSKDDTAQESARSLKKRKRDDQPAPLKQRPAKRKRERSTPPPSSSSSKLQSSSSSSSVGSTSSESSSSSSSSDTNTESTSDSDSDSDTSSSTSGSSADSSASSALASKEVQVQNALGKNGSTSARKDVAMVGSSGKQPVRSTPPGAGSQATRDRNARRRKLRRALKAESKQAQAPASGGSETRSETGTTPAAASVAQTTSTPTITKQPRAPGVTSMPTNISNRNKRRGFVDEMKNVEPMHIVYSAEHERAATLTSEPLEPATAPPPASAPLSAPEKAAAAIAAAASTQSTQGTTVPAASPQKGPAASSHRTEPSHHQTPSELSSLPPNVFISSKQFHAARASAARTKRSAKAAAVPAPPPAAVINLTWSGDMLDEEGWQAAEAAWDSATVITQDMAQALREGQVVAWKALELDLYTFSPEIKLKLARVETDGRLRLLRTAYEQEAEEEQEGAAEEAPTFAELIDGEHRLIC